MRTVTFLTTVLAAFSLTANANSWMHYDDTNSPLPSNTVNITFNDGAITWIGTDNGLVRYNGSDWTVYQSESSDLPDDNVHDIHKDDFGNMWIATDKGVLKISNNGWEVFNESNSDIPSDLVRAISSDSHGNLWIGTWGNGIAKFDGSNWATYDTENSELPSNGIFTLEMNENDQLWIGSFNGGATMFNGQTWTVYNTSNSGLPHNHVRSITFDYNNIIWFGTDDGIARRAWSGHWDVFTYLELGHSVHTIYAGFQTEPGHLFFSTDGGLVEFNGSGHNVYSAQNSNLPSNNLRSVSEDHSGNLWLGTGSSGLAVFSLEGTLSITDQPQTKNLFTPYPNPTTQGVILNLSSGIHSDFDVLVHNTAGQLVMQERMNGFGASTYNIDLSKMQPGALMISVISDRFIDTQQVLKL